MAAPTAGPLGTPGSLLDLTGANQATYSGLTVDGTAGAFALTSNSLRASASAVTRGYKSSPTYGPNGEMWFQVNGVDTTVGTGVWAIMRFADSGLSTKNFIEFGIERVTGPQYNLTAYQINNNVGGTIGTFLANATVAVGDWWAFTAQGGTDIVTVRAWKWDGVSAWVQQGVALTFQPSDTGNLAAGSIGFEMDGANTLWAVGSVGGGTVNNVLWQQWVNNFDSTAAGTGCSASVNTGAASPDTNTLTSTIASATDGSDKAEGVVTSGLRLPAGSEGRVRFKFKTPATFNLLANSSFFIASNASAQSVMELYIDATKKVNTFVPTGMMAAGGGTTAGVTVLAANTEYTIEVAWKQNSFYTVWLNGSVEINVSTGTGSTLSAVSTKMVWGIDHYDGTDTNGWSNVIRWAQVGDNSATALTDPSVPSSGTRSLMLLGVGS